MKKSFNKITLFIFIFWGISNFSLAQQVEDSLRLPYPINPSNPNPYSKQKASSNLNLKTPKNMRTEVEYDEKSNQYIIRQKVGNTNVGVPYIMSFDEYKKYDVKKGLREHWRKRYKEETFEGQKSIIPKINIGGQVFETIFGSSTIDIRPQGSVKLRFGVKHTRNSNPSQPVELQRSTTFDFKPEIQMNVTGKIGENLEMKVNYNTESSFDFENTMNLRYQGKEDDIIQKIEAGNVSMPLSTSLISGSQSLMGILTELKFGRLHISTVFSQQKGETKTITVEGGAQKSQYEMEAVMYEKNKHFFIAHYFRENYDKTLANLPTLSSPITISKIEVWVTNTTRKIENARNILGFMDLGEEKTTRSVYNQTEQSILNTAFVSAKNYRSPDNKANDLYEKLTTNEAIRDINQASQVLNGMGLKGGIDYEKVEFARKLLPNEYTFNAKLGYISLNYALNADEVLAVAFEYTVGGTSEVLQVGEFSSDGIEHPKALMLKLLKGTNFNPIYPNWKLMMKNIYSLGAYQINKEDFIMEVEFYDDETGTKLFNLPERENLPPLNKNIKNVKLLNLLNLDNLDQHLNYTEKGNGVFDFVENITIDAAKGKIIFPMLEPFGRYLGGKINNATLAEKLTYNEIYDSTQYKAKQITAKNKFFISGSYKSEGGSEIFLNAFDIPQGSVKVTAGGIVLQENVDYTVDYNMGRVKIVNESYLASGTPLKISLESKSMFNLQSKTLIGTHLDYRFSENFNLGATVMHLMERPYTEKVNIGEEPISNTIWGLNGAYRTEVPFITKMIDFLPLIATKEKSSLAIEGEFAQLKPGHNKAIGKAGEAFIDDFEGSESSINLRGRNGWVLASVPQQYEYTGRFKEAELMNDLASGYQRAKLAWYQIDPLFFRSGSPVSKEQQENYLVYRVQEQDIYPNKDLKNGDPTEIATLDLSYYPNIRGPYNYNTDDLQSDGKLNNPKNKWAGIMRQLTTNDFEASNVEYIEFWMMDPFVEENEKNTGGKLFFNLGNVSEDILKDGRKSYEHGMPTDGSDKYITTAWGRMPALQTANPGFVNDGNLREKQDIGLDGLSSKTDDNGNSDERTFFQENGYLAKVAAIIKDPKILQQFYEDPSNDDYEYFRSDKHDERGANILERYFNYNNHEGNTPYIANSTSSYNPTGQQSPDVEDINGDFTLSENEAYFQYELDLTKENMRVGSNYITDVRTITKSFAKDKPVNWYQFKIPINEFTNRINNISDFKSIRFIRMFLTEWESPVVLRFAKLELVRGEWRKYEYTIKESDEGIVGDENYDPTKIPFAVSTVNIEENGSRVPIHYVLPNGVDRQQDPSNPQMSELNEQAMVLRVDDLKDGYSKAVYKTINMDMRNYGNLKMFIHAEARNDELSLRDKDITCFIRLGSDYTENYYEYEVPLQLTPWGKYYNNASDREAVWPQANEMLINFKDLTDLKMKRNAAMRSATPTASLMIPFVDMLTQKIGEQSFVRRISIKGNPNLAQVKTIMIGIKNPLKKYNPFGSDDGESKSAEIWVNELRLSGFDEEGGWAATGRINLRLADLGTFSIAGSTTKAGFGSIEQSAQKRTKEEVNQIDIATNLELGKLFPKEAKVRIPFYIGYSRTAINPKYNPLDQDIVFKESLKDPSLTEGEKKQLKDIAQNLTERKSLNFTNVGIGHSGKGKVRFYSPSNISLSYAYSEVAIHNVSTQYNSTKNYMGAVNYVFNNQPKNIQPFKKIKFLNKPALRLIGDFNFFLSPSQVAFQTDMNRKYNEILLRNLNNPAQVFVPSYNKNFDWNRKFNIKYNLSKSLKLDYAINTTAIIDEPEGDMKSDYTKFKEKVWQSILEMGTPLKHNQRLDVSYTLPINKIPLLNWISATANYSSLYNWERGPILHKKNTEENKPLQDSINNKVANSQKINFNAQLSLNRLYSKVGFLDKIDKKYKQSAAQRNKKKYETATFTKNKVSFKSNKPRIISHNLGTEEEIKIKLSEGGRPIPAEFDIKSDKKISITTKEEVKNVKVEISGRREVKNNPIVFALEQTARILMGFKQVSSSYSLTRGSILSGYTGKHQFGSLNDAPGLPFVFGHQDLNIPKNLAEKGLLISDTSLISPFQMSKNEAFMIKSTFEPFKGLRIDFSAKWNQTNNFNEYFFPTYSEQRELLGLERMNQNYTGSYNIDIMMIKTAFETKPSAKNIHSAAYEQFKKNIHKIAWRLAQKREGISAPGFEGGYHPGNYSDTTMPLGYSSSNPEVAIPAFLAAYMGEDAGKTSLDIFNLKRIRPSWRVKFDGLSHIQLVKKYFKNISISHGYNSSFIINSYSSNVLYSREQARNSDYGNMSWTMGKVDSTMFVPEYNITTFASTERFMPLIGIDLTWKNNVLTKIEYKKTRALTMSLANNMLNEVYTWDWVIGSGYRFDKLRIKINKKAIESDLNLRADLSIRDGITINRDLLQNNSEIIAGQKVFTLKLTADYQLSNKLAIQVYFDHKLTDPKVTASAFRNSITNFGFMLQFSLAE